MGGIIVSRNVTIYKRKRIKSGLSKVDMARELGIDYKRYNLIERGDVKMPNKLIDKFNEIINRGQENKIVSLENGVDASDYWKELCKKDDNGTPKLYKKMREFNISNVKELAILLGYKSPGMIYQYLKEDNVVNEDFTKRVYLFFTNELNIQEPKKEEMIIYPRSTKENTELDEYFKNTDFKGIMKEHGLTSKDVYTKIGIDGGAFSKLINKIQRPGDVKMEKIKNYFDELDSDVSEISTSINFGDFTRTLAIDENGINVSLDEQFPEIPNKDTTEELLEKYREEMRTINNEIDGHNEAIKRLMTRKDVCFEIMGVIEEISNNK